MTKVLNPTADLLEVDTLGSLFRHLGNSLDLDETLSTLDRELRRLIAFDAISVHLLEGGQWVPAYVAGAAFESIHTLTVPLPAAIIKLYREGERAFGRQDLEVVRDAAEKIAAAIANARQYRDALRVAEIDPATGLLNGRALFGRLDAELARARRSKAGLGVFQCRLQGA